MENDRDRAKREAQTQMQRAAMFWAAYRRSAERIRYSCLLKSRALYMTALELSRPEPRGRLLRWYQDIVDAMTDLRLCEESNMDSIEETARGAEMMARIWYEEADGNINSTEDLSPFTSRFGDV